MKKLLTAMLVIFSAIAGPVSSRDFADFNVVAEINKFNSSVKISQPQCFKNKIKLMTEEIFPFLRGTAHLMNIDMQRASSLAFLRTSPMGLTAGDLHIHNFSVFIASGKPAIYVIDDLDEAFANAPLAFDIFRLAVSFVVGFSGKLGSKELTLAIENLLAGYNSRAASSATHDWSQAKLPDFLQSFVAKESLVSHKKFIKKKTVAKTKNKFDYSKHEPVSEIEKKSVYQAMRAYLDKIAATRGISKSETEILDIAQRFNKGLSSIGLKRYFVLLRGKNGDWSGNIILEVKIIRPGSVGISSVTKQSRDTLEAMTRAYLARDPYLGTVNINNRPFLVRQNFAFSTTLENTDLSEPRQVAAMAKVLGYITADFHAASGQGSVMQKWLQQYGKDLPAWVFKYVKQLKDDWNVLKSAKF